MTPAAKFAVLTDELRETREAAAMLRVAACNGDSQDARRLRGSGGGR